MHDEANAESGEVQVQSKHTRRTARQVLCKHRQDRGWGPGVGPFTNRRHVALSAHSGRDDGLG